MPPTTNTTNRTIVLKGMGHHFEGRLDTIASPGMAVTMAADGDWDPCVPAQAAALKGGLVVLKEDALQGKTIDDAYAVDDVCFLYQVEPGDEINLLVKSGEDIDVGDKLVVEGGTSGLFVEAAGTETKFQFEALEDTGGALAANDHVRCRCLAP